MKNLDFKQYWLIIVSLTFIFFDALATDIPAGNVSGTWTIVNSPYLINGNIMVPNDSTLIIQPGVNVIFQNYYKFSIKGRLLAIGTQEDSIVFTSQNLETGWHGLNLKNVSPSNDTTIFKYCKFEYGKANSGNYMEDKTGGAIYCEGSKLRISQCLFRYNLSFNPTEYYTGGGAISIFNGNPVVEYCEFYENTADFGSAIVIWSSLSSPVVRNNYFHDNSGHGLINIGEGASPILLNNYIVNNICNQHGFIHFSNGSGKTILVNNTIVYNSGGTAIFLNDGSEPLFINDIIWGNAPAQVNLETSSALSFYNCLIEGGSDGFIGRDYFSGQYQNCLNSDPLFESPNECRLQNNSPCIGAGVKKITIDNVTYQATLNDFYGTPRPAPKSSQPDIGAFENLLGSPVVEIKEELNLRQDNFQLYQNYPNPYNPLTKIKFSIPHLSKVIIKIFDVLGKEVATLVNEQKSPGTYEVTWNAINLPSGVYFYRLQAGSFVETKKMVLMK